MGIVIITVMAIGIFLPLILMLESWLNKDDEYREIEKWHNFKTGMGKKND